MISIIIGGDVCPINRNEPYFKKGDAKSIFNDLLPEFQSADLSIVNLECPLIERETPIMKEGPVHAVSSDCIQGITGSDIDVLCLANNHILDHGAEGLLNTLRICADSGVSIVGAGHNLREAGRLLIRKLKGMRIGLLAVAEHEFSIATDQAPGANPLDIISYVRTVKDQGAGLDYLIVLVHAGISGHPLPSPRLRESCRFMAEMGADTVICQHSHCPGTFEYYNDSYIVYGQGNLIFDEVPNADSPWNKGFLVKLSIKGKGDHVMDIIPYIQSAEKAGARKMSEEASELFKAEIYQNSEMLVDTSYIKRQWEEICKKNENRYYFQILFGFLNNRLFRTINRKIPFAKYFYTKRHMSLLENMIKCESHREAIEFILEKDRKGPAS